MNSLNINFFNIDYPQDETERELLLSLLNSCHEIQYLFGSPGREYREKAMHRALVDRLTLLSKGCRLPELLRVEQAINQCRPFGDFLWQRPTGVPSAHVSECLHWLCPSCHLRRVFQIINRVGLAGIEKSSVYRAFIHPEKSDFKAHVNALRQGLETACNTPGKLKFSHWGSRLRKHQGWIVELFAFSDSYHRAKILLPGTGAALEAVDTATSAWDGVSLFRNLYHFDSFTVCRLNVEQCPLYFTSDYPAFDCKCA